MRENPEQGFPHLHHPKQDHPPHQSLISTLLLKYQSKIPHPWLLHKAAARPNIHSGICCFQWTVVALLESWGGLGWRSWSPLWWKKFTEQDCRRTTKNSPPKWRPGDFCIPSFKSQFKTQEAWCYPVLSLSLQATSDNATSLYFLSFYLHKGLRAPNRNALQDENLEYKDIQVHHNI